MREDKKLQNLFVLVILQSFYFYDFFQNYEFWGEIAESKYEFNILHPLLIHLFSNLVDSSWILEKFLKTLPRTDDISCHKNIRGIRGWSNIP